MLLILEWWLMNGLSFFTNFFNQQPQELGTFMFASEFPNQSLSFYIQDKQENMIYCAGPGWNVSSSKCQTRKTSGQQITLFSWEQVWSAVGEGEHWLSLAALVWDVCQQNVNSNILPEKHGLGTLYSQQFIGDLTESSASAFCQKVDVERKKVLFQPFLMREITVEATCFSLSSTRQGEPPIQPASFPASQPFLLGCFPSLCGCCCGEDTHWQHLANTTLLCWTSYRSSFLLSQFLSPSANWWFDK